MYLIPLADFLMHGVVLQSRESWRVARPSADVSRETFLRKSPGADFVRAAAESPVAILWQRACPVVSAPAAV
jgi:hypothetical protein